MASSSNSSVQKSFKYDVFISFRGEDTRKTFVDHLYEALKDKGIYTYKDDEKIEQGKTIDNQLIQAIRGSRYFIIVFSKNYASSSWCLDELVEIIECQKTGEQTAYPVFFYVEPTEVRKQTGAFGKAFLKNKNKDAAGKWIEALKGASNLAGRELKATANGHEAKFINKIVQEISLELRSINFDFDEKLVGMETRVEDVVSSLEIGIDEVRIIGIKGMGGAGKTTLARAAFDHLSHRFEATSFVENVRETSNGSDGLKKLQEQVLSDVLNGKVTVNGVFDGKNMMKRRMCSKKVLLVLDDVDHIEQLKALAGEPNWFKPGSRILITTRDEQVLIAHRVNVIRDIVLFSKKEAISLFSRYAFGRENPLQGWEELSGKVVRYAAGLPLTLEVLGSFLCGKDKLEWVDAIDRLEKIPLKDTLEKLELRYISLEDDYKEIFLDIACMLKGEKKEDAIRILESCGFNARIGLKVLELRSLITLSSKYGRLVLDMHDHIEEMGKNIVRRLHPDEPNRHSRLWIDEEIEDILANDMGTEETRCLKLKKSRVNARIIMKGLGKMKKLRYLEVIFDGGSLGSNPKLDDTTQYFPNSLKYLKCIHYPFLYLPKTFLANNLVGLEMEDTRRMIQLWKEGEEKILTKLRFLSLFWSFLRTSDFRITPNLETLYLRDCFNLVEFSSCQKLNYLYISHSKLRTFDLGLTPNIDRLSLDNCADFEELHVSVACTNLKHLHIHDSKLRTFDLGLTPNIERLSLYNCADFEELHVSVACTNLKHLHIHDSKLRTFDLGLTPNIERLSLYNCADFEELHVSVACTNLKHLHIHDSKLRTFNLGLTPNIERLSLYNCADFEELHVSVACTNLKHLHIHDSKLRTFDLGLTPNIERLSLYNCADFEELHVSVACTNLKHLHIHDSKLRTFDLGLTPNIERLFLDNCADFEELHVSVACPNLKVLDLRKSRLRSLDLELIPNLENLYLADCYHFVELYVSVACPNLKFLNLSNSRLRSLDLELIPNLESLNLANCDRLVEINAPVGCLKKVGYLNLSGGLRFSQFEFGSRFEPKVSRSSPSLDLVGGESLHLIGCFRFPKFVFGGGCEPNVNCSSATLDLIGEFLDSCPLHPNSNLPKLQFRCYYDENLPSSVGNFEKLISFGVCACTDFKKFSNMICSLRCLREFKVKCDIPESPEFPKDLGQLECLEELCLCSTKIKHLPDSICMLKHLKSLEVYNGYRVEEREDLLEKLPEDLGQLECLEKLYVCSKKIEYLPDSICMLKCLKWLEVTKCCRLGKLPEDIGRLESLWRLVLSATTVKHLPDSICLLKRLKYLLLDRCAHLEKLPEDLGRLECLKHLDITDTSISHLPQSIYGLKGLLIAAPPELLQLYDFHSEIKTTTKHIPWYKPSAHWQQIQKLG